MCVLYQGSSHKQHNCRDPKRTQTHEAALSDGLYCFRPEVLRLSLFILFPNVCSRYRSRLKLTGMSLNDKIIADITTAMRSKDAERLSTLRMVKANLMNRKIEKGSDLTDEEVQKALQSLVKQRRDSIEQYEKGGRAELAAKEALEITHIEAYLPQAATPEEVEQAVAEAVAETGASSMKEMGQVMKAAQAKLQGKSVDGRALSESIKSKLQ